MLFEGVFYTLRLHTYICVIHTRRTDEGLSACAPQSATQCTHMRHARDIQKTPRRCWMRLASLRPPASPHTREEQEETRTRCARVGGDPPPHTRHRTRLGCARRMRARRRACVAPRTPHTTLHTHKQQHESTHDTLTSRNPDRRALWRVYRLPRTQYAPHCRRHKTTPEHARDQPRQTKRESGAACSSAVGSHLSTRACRARL